METSLDTTLFFVVFLTATFAASLVAGLAGFAFGLVAAAMLLYILTPLQTATLIIWYGLIVQGYAVWKLRHAIQITPLVIGAALEDEPGEQFSSRSRSLRRIFRIA